MHTTVREANDRGFECIVLEDCTASYNLEFHRVSQVGQVVEHMRSSDPVVAAPGGSP